MNIAIVLAGGVGARVGSEIPKQFIKIFEKPIMIYTLETFEKCSIIDKIILVCIGSHIDLAKQYCYEHNITKVSNFIEGGKEFVNSCMNGMNSLRNKCENDDIVIITSADRPFLSQEEIEDAIRVCEKKGSGVAARPCSLCMFKVGNDRTGSSEYLRNNLMQTATPWAFRYGSLLSALDLFKDNKLPNCEPYPIAIYAAAGNTIYFSKAKAENIKITEPYDIALMEQMIIQREAPRK